MAKVSVVIPAYNCASFLPAAVESVLAQGYADLETIVVDDGSTDETEAALAPYGRSITYLRQANRGLPGARNAGIRASTGEFVALLDADDAWVPGKLAQQMPRFADSQVGLVYTDFAVRYADGRYQPSYLVNRPLAGEGDVFERYIQSRFLFPSTMVFRRVCLEEAGLFDEEMLACEDIELFARICARWKVARVNEALMIRYEGVHNITANTERMSEYTILALGKVLARTPELTQSRRATVEKELGKQFWWNGYAAFARGDVGKARRSLWKAMRFDREWARKCLPLLAVTMLPGSAARRMQAMRRSRDLG